ncbi:MAG: hypothetical protein HY858_07255, partial [Candidatus Solibacter usitatus]|nr:hypothetical protein [Candidatus Solibacter usitatus]
MPHTTAIALLLSFATAWLSAQPPAPPAPPPPKPPPMIRTVLDAAGRPYSLLDNNEELTLRVTALPPDAKLDFMEADGALIITAARGAQLRIAFPRESFAGGTAAIGGALSTLGPRQQRLPQASATQAVLHGPAGRVTLTTSTPRLLSIEDRWERRARTYSFTVELAGGPVEASLAFTSTPDTAPASLLVHPDQLRARFHGFGGNYCWPAMSSVTLYTLANIKSAWARVEMSLEDWEPQNDNDDSSTVNWEVLKSHDRPNSRLRNQLLTALEIQKKGIPYVASIWWLPEWIYANPNQQPRSDHRRRVAIDKWDELLESIGSYLLYAKQQYGVEPDLFSFNEANIGVYLFLDPEEHRQALISIGRHLRKLGLKTKMLLADATGPDGTYTYALPAASDPEALAFCGAISFHSWGGASPDMYKAWGDLAEWTGLPLLVAEMGVDSAAYRSRSYDSYAYGLRELRMQQELIIHARPQSLLFWQYTEDYALAKSTPNSGGSPLVEPTPRFWLMQQLANLTPMQSDSLVTASNHPNVLVTAFRSG